MAKNERKKRKKNSPPRTTVNLNKKIFLQRKALSVRLLPAHKEYMLASINLWLNIENEN
jgi:hypothetical protein